jgi:probable F420-dependent oxidoreductase
MLRIVPGSRSPSSTDNGLGLFLTGLPAPLAIDYAVRSEQEGFRSAWFPEITFADSFGPAVAASQRTQRIGLGPGVVGVWSRSPVTLALQAATLHQLSGGRLLLGLGVQARGYVEGWHGQRYRKPLAAMRDMVTILRRVLRGEAVSYEGEIFSIRSFQLQMELPERRPRIYVAANGPKMIQLAGEIADGMIGYFHSVEYVRDVVMPNLREGVKRGGRSLDDLDVTVGFPALVTRDESGIELVKGQVMMFATALDSAPAYADSVRAAGYESEMAEIQARVAAGDLAGAVAAVPDEMANALTMAGTADNVRRRLDAYRDAGLTGVMLNPSPPGGYFPLYEGHFPENAALPPFDFPGFMNTLDATVDLLGA